MASSSIQALQASINKALKLISDRENLVNISYIRNASDAVYAVYVFVLILKAIKQIAGKNAIQLSSIRQQPRQSEIFQLATQNVSKTFIVRGAPGTIFSNRQDYGFAEFTLSEKTYEIHLGVRYFGASHVLHEFDISIINKKDANQCRRKKVSPGSRTTDLVFECKFYSRNLDIGLGRELVGLITDFQSIKIARLVTNSDSASVRPYLRKRIKYKFNSNLVPSEPDLETEFINAVADDLRNRL